MTLTALSTLALITLAAVISPLLADLTGRVGIPDVVILLALGIVIGPEVLAIAHPDVVIDTLSYMGLSYLMFLAGYELDLNRIRGRPLRLAVLGWVMSFVLALFVGYLLVSSDLAVNTLVVGLALTTTALGTLLPVLRDAGADKGAFGARILAIGTVGEFGPILAVAILLNNRNRAQTALLLGLFAVVAVMAALVAGRAKRPKLVATMHRHMQSSSQLPVRVSVLLIVALVYFAFRLGLDVLLGAFAAGIVFRLFAVGDDSEMISGKLEAIGFGFLVPIFFVVSGVRLNLEALFHQPSAFLRLPLFLILFLVVRGAPAMLLYRRDLPSVQLVPLALLSATGLPLIVVITTIGVAEHRMVAANAAALVGAGMLSVLIYPLAAKVMLRRAGSPQGDR